jgi:hypothetical protein
MELARGRGGVDVLYFARIVGRLDKGPLQAGVWVKVASPRTARARGPRGPLQRESEPGKRCDKRGQRTSGERRRGRAERRAKHQVYSRRRRRRTRRIIMMNSETRRRRTRRTVSRRRRRIGHLPAPAPQEQMHGVPRGGGRVDAGQSEWKSAKA